MSEHLSPSQPDQNNTSKPPRPSFSRRNFLIRAGAVGIGALLTGDQEHNEWNHVRLPEGKPPAEQVGNAVGLGERFINGLRRPLYSSGEPGEVLSEYYGLPIRVVDSMGVSLLPGRDGAIRDAVNHYSSEEQTISYPGITLKATVDWDVGGNYKVSVANSGSTDAVTVMLGDREIGRIQSGQQGDMHLVLPKNDVSPLQSARFTERHGEQIAWAMARAKGDKTREEMYENQLRGRGYQPGLDLHMPIWGEGTEYPDDFPKNGDVLHDCDAGLISTSVAYEYNSKVCLTPDLYRELMKHDILVPLITSLHVLNKYGDPEHRVAGQSSPLEVATNTIQDFHHYGEAGIPMRISGLHSNNISALRTAHFGALMTALGYTHGITQYQPYADRVAQLFLREQIGTDGIVHTTDGDYLRPAVAGGVPLAWGSDLGQTINPPIYYKAIDKLFERQPQEYNGIIPSNAETTASALAFFHRYNGAVHSH